MDLAQLAQIVPASIFSGGEFTQQSSPYNAFEQYGCYSDEMVDGQVPYCGYQQEAHPQDFVSYGGGCYYQEIKQEPKFEMTGGFTHSQMVPPYSPASSHSSCQQVGSLGSSCAANEYGLSKDRPVVPADRINQLMVIQALDVQTVCQILNIPPEPMFWNKEQTHAWLMWNCQQFHLPPLDLNKFDMEGFRLSLLNEAEFEKLAPGCGDVLWSLLDAWREAGMAVKTEVDIGGYMSMPTHSPAGSSGTDSGFDTEDVSEVDDHCNDNDEMESTGGSHTPLYRFLGETLDKPHLFGGAIRWLDRSKGIFKIEDSARVARLWGKRKNRPAMNYDKMSRSIRQYYKKGIMKKTERSQRLVYQFCPAYIP